MSSINRSQLLYHIVIFLEDDVSNVHTPICDCQHFIQYSNSDTFGKLIPIIHQSLKQHSDYNEITNYLSTHHSLTLSLGHKTKRRQDLSYEKLSALLKLKSDDFISDIDLRNGNSSDDHLCVFIIIIHKDVDPSPPPPKHKPTKQITAQEASKSYTRSRRRRKRRTIALYSEDEDSDNRNNHNYNHNKPIPKRRKLAKTQLIQMESSQSSEPESESESEAECLWLLVDTALYKVTNVRECIKTIVSDVWKRNHIKYIGMYAFDRRLQRLALPKTYTKRNESFIVKCFDSITEHQCITGESVIRSVDQLLTIIRDSKLDCASHRIVLFCGKYGASSKTAVTNLENRLKRSDVIFDCIQVSSSPYPNRDLFKLCNQHGKMWSPRENDKEWKWLPLCSDFISPNKRNIGVSDAIVLE